MRRCAIKLSIDFLHGRLFQGRRSGHTVRCVSKSSLSQHIRAGRRMLVTVQVQPVCHGGMEAVVCDIAWSRSALFRICPANSALISGNRGTVVVRCKA